MIVLLFAIVLIIRVAIRRSNKETQHISDKVDDYLLEDQLANLSRAKPLDDTLFIEVEEEDIPKTDIQSADVIRQYDEVIRAIQRPLMKIPDTWTNREIKEMYGAKNFQILAGNEENFRRFLHAGNYYAEALIEHEYLAEAKAMLALLIKKGSDISKTYSLYQELPNLSEEERTVFEEQIALLDERLQERIRHAEG